MLTVQEGVTVQERGLTVREELTVHEGEGRLYKRGGANYKTG